MDPMIEPPPIEAPLAAGPPPLFDVSRFSDWVTEVFTAEHDDEVLDKLAAMDASDDMAKMRLLLNEEVATRRATAKAPAVATSYTPPEPGAGYKDVMVIAFAGENDMLVRAPPTPPRYMYRTATDARACADRDQDAPPAKSHSHSPFLRLGCSSRAHAGWPAGQPRPLLRVILQAVQKVRRALGRLRARRHPQLVPPRHRRRRGLQRAAGYDSQGGGAGAAEGARDDWRVDGRVWRGPRRAAAAG